MKKSMLLLVLFPLMAAAERIWQDPSTGISWTYWVNDGKARVERISRSPVGALTIPSVLGGCPVTSIGLEAFSGYSRLTSVTIPSSVTSIGSGAFSGCSGLTAVNVDDLAKWCEIAFGFDSNPLCYAKKLYLDGKEVIHLDIPNGVKVIGDHAFYGCSGLISVTIPSSVTSIGGYAFMDCSGLTSVTIPSSVTSIGEGAFCGCSGLTSVTIPSSVTSIGECVFSGCSGLTSVTIPSSVTSIEKYAFDGCCGLTSVTIPACVTRLSRTFPDASEKIQKVVICEGVTSIGDRAFMDCSGLTSVTIPSSVTSIGGYAFDGCCGLTSVTIPSSVTSIGKCAFYGCSGLTSVTIPEGVTSIGDMAFSDCSGLTSVTIPSSVTSIGPAAFIGCSGLKSVMILSSEISIGYQAFYDCSELAELTILSRVMSVGNAAFGLCNGLTTVVCLSGTVERIKSLLRNEKLDFRLLAPVFVPPSGTEIDGSLKISITSAVENARIHYTMDGSDPTTNSPLFKKFLISEKTEIRAIAECWGVVSDVGTAVYAKGWCETPVISSDEGVFRFSGKEVRITCASEGAEIRYTIDGTIPTAQSPLYEGPFTIDDTTMVRAIAVGHPDYFDSEVASATFTREWLKVTTPVLSANGSVSFTGSKCVISVMRDGTQESVLRYTFDGSDPTEQSPVLEGDSIVVTASATVKVRAFIDDWQPSDVAVVEVVKIWVLGDALNQSDVTFSTGVDHPWVADRDFTHDGKESARSGVVPHNGCSWFQTTVYGDKTVKFWWKVSSEEDWDELSFMTNGVVVAKISGERDWTEVSLPVSAGTVIRWEYNKDESTSDGSDCGWVDEISLISTKPTIEGDGGATVTGDAETGFVIKPSEEKTVVEVTIPGGIDAGLVTVEVSPKVESVMPNGAKVKIVSGGADITEFLNVPAADGNGVVDLTKATVKEALVKEAMDIEKGAVIDLCGGSQGAASPTITTAPTRVGLFYQFREGETLDGMKDGDSKVGDGEAWTPNITVKGGNSAFYSIGVGKGK